LRFNTEKGACPLFRGRTEGVVIAVVVEDLGAAVAAVDHVIAIAADSGTGSPWHGTIMAARPALCKALGNFRDLTEGVPAGPIWRRLRQRQNDVIRPIMAVRLKI
jgi:hypothetical protein